MFDNNPAQTRGSALVATFPTSQAARTAVERLHDEGFHDTWIGVTRKADNQFGSVSGAATDVVVESDNALARFFGFGDESLHEALLKHGVSETDAMRVDETLPVDSAVLTVDGANHPELAAQIIATCGGELLGSAGSAGLYDAYADEPTADRRSLPSERLSGLGDYRAGEKLEEARRLQLRQERLAIDKRQESAGEAVIGTRVTSNRTDVDVPVYREEIYVERRPATGTYGNVDAIRDGETIRIPLTREVLDVQKRTIVTDEVEVGKRRVEGVEHVSETLRKEELDVDGTQGGLRDRG